MKIGLVGLPGSGKSTVFRLLTGHSDSTRRADGIAVVQVPDPRLDRIFQIYQPKKMTYAELTVLDLLAAKGRGSGEGSAEGALHWVKAAGDADAFALVVQCFGHVDYSGAPLDARADLEAVLLEMALTDLGIVEGRMERIKAKGRKREVTEEWELHVLGQVRDHLAKGGLVAQLELSEDKQKLLRGFGLLTAKPLLVILNIGEDEAEEERAVDARQFAEQAGLAHVTVCARLDEEVAELPAEEQKQFLSAYGFAEPARERLIKAAYRLLDTITFFTVNNNEARAWTVPAGTTAVEAAGKIHSDMAAGFIRVEVIPFQALDEAGSVAEIKKQNLSRIEGRDYIVQDGDILQVRFSR